MTKKGQKDAAARAQAGHAFKREPYDNNNGNLIQIS